MPTIRSATATDLPAVAEIYAHYVAHSCVTFDLEAPSVQEWDDKLERLQGQGWPFRVATVDDLVIGFAYVAPWRVKPAYRLTLEDTVYLAPDHTGRGYGRWLLTDLLREASAAGARQIVAVIADAGNDTSVRLHRALGFTDTGRLHAVGYKHARWIDVILMQKPLQPDRPAKPAR